jgi:hypothetical protein
MAGPNVACPAQESAWLTCQAGDREERGISRTDAEKAARGRLGE